MVLTRTHRLFFFFSSRRRHTRSKRDWSSDVCSSDLAAHARAHSGDRAHPDGAHLAGKPRDRKSVVEGKSVDLGGRRIVKKKNTNKAEWVCVRHTARWSCRDLAWRYGVA